MSTYVLVPSTQVAGCREALMLAGLASFRGTPQQVREKDSEKSGVGILLIFLFVEGLEENVQGTSE